MTAATLHRPTHPGPEPMARRGSRPVTLPRQRGLRPAEPPRLRLVPADHPLSTALPAPAAGARVRGVDPAVRLTRRGRWAALVGLVLLGLVLMVGLTGLVGSAAAGNGPTRPAARTVVVQPGQTLWSIAGEVAPGADRQDTIARIVELNSLPGTGVSAGDRIAVPAR